MKHLTLLMLLSIVNSFSWADQRPTSGLIYGMTTNDGLLYQCASVSESIIQCDFSQIKVRKSTTREKVIEQGKSALDEWSTPEAKRSREKRFTKEKCDEIKNSIAAAETEKVHSEVKELIGQEQLQDNPDYKKLWSEKFLALCYEPSRENYLALIGLQSAKELKTCKVSVNNWERTLEKIPTANIWYVRESPRNVCSTLDVSRFQLAEDSDFFWDYFSQKKVLNPEENLFGSMECADLDEDEYQYSYRGNNDIQLDCEWIEYSVF